MNGRRQGWSGGGFHAINAHSVRYDELPRKYARTRPGHGNIPAAYISMIGRDTRHNGKGCGADLLVDALRRIARAAEALGVAVVMLDVLDCGDAEKVARRKVHYEQFGFSSLPSNELRMFPPMATVRELIAETSWRRCNRRWNPVEFAATRKRDLVVQCSAEIE